MNRLTLVAAVAGFAGVELVRRWAERNRVLDIPNERSSHSNPVPRGGGLAIVVIVLGGVVVAAWLYDIPVTSHLSVYLITAAAIALISWADDVWTMPTSTRLAIHVAAAFTLAVALSPVQTVAIFHVGVVAFPLIVIWVVGLTNAYNFMDGIDAMAGQQAIVASVGWLLVTRAAPHPLIELLAPLILGSSLGFLFHNRPPARIFMGDVGSAFLGFSLAAVPLLEARRDSVLIAALLLWPFIFDTTFTFLRRMRRRERLFVAHRSHLYQKLTIAGHSHAAVSSLYAVLSMAGVGAAEATRRGYAVPAVISIAGLAVMLTLLVRFEEQRTVDSSKRGTAQSGRHGLTVRGERARDTPPTSGR